MKELNIKARVETDEAQKSTKSLSDKLDNLIENQKKSLETQKKLGRETKESLDAATDSSVKLAKGFRGVGLAIKAAGIGLVIELLGQVREILGQNQLITDKFNVAFKALSQSVNDFVDFVTGEGAIDTISNFFTELIDNPSKAIGGAIDSLKEYTKETVNAAEANVQLENSARLAAAQQQRLIEQFDRQAEQQRQIRDNDQLSIDERIAANERLGQVLNRQLELEGELIRTRIASAEAAVEQNNNIDNQVALIEALAEQDALLAKVEGFRSEQLINRNSLEKELNKELEIRVAREQALKELEKIDSKSTEVKSEEDIRIEQNQFLNDTLLAQNREFAKQDVEIKKRSAAEKIEIERLRADNEIQLQQSLFNLAGALAKQGSEEAKGIAVAQVLFDTYKGIQATFASAAANPASILFPGFPFVQSGIAAAFGFANVRKILSTSSSGGSGGGSAPSFSSSAGSGGGRQVVPNIESINQGVGQNQNSRFSNLRAYIIQDNLEDQSALSQKINDL